MRDGNTAAHRRHGGKGVLDDVASGSSRKDFEYRVERLEKQRQNVEGGSLFVTSPRSFLMGFNKSF
jgi:hypothetical protein